MEGEAVHPEVEVVDFEEEDEELGAESDAAGQVGVHEAHEVVVDGRGEEVQDDQAQQRLVDGHPAAPLEFGELQSARAYLEGNAEEGDRQDDVEADLHDHDDQVVGRVLLFLPQRDSLDPLSVLEVRPNKYGLGIEQKQ